MKSVFNEAKACSFVVASKPKVGRKKAQGKTETRNQNIRDLHYTLLLFNAQFSILVVQHCDVFTSNKVALEVQKQATTATKSKKTVDDDDDDDVGRCSWH